MAWPAIAPRNLVLAGLALAINLLLLAWIGLLGLYSLPYLAAPAGLLFLRDMPVVFRIVAAVLGVIYTGYGLLSFYFGGLILVPSGLALLVAAALPPLRRAALVWTIASVAAAIVAALAMSLILLAL